MLTAYVAHELWQVYVCVFVKGLIVMWRLYEKVLRCAFKLSQSQRASRSLAKTGLFLGTFFNVFFTLPFYALR